MVSSTVFTFALTLLLSHADAFSIPSISTSTTKPTTTTTTTTRAFTNYNNNNNNINININNNPSQRSSPLYSHDGQQINNNEYNPTTFENIRKAGLTMALTTTLALQTVIPNTIEANAYDATDYASETVTSVVKDLADARGDAKKTFLAFEEIAEIIAEGKGIGGSINYSGVEINRGYVADEDTTIYNPGLSLLTESEKERLTDAILQNRASNIRSKTWSQDNESAFAALKTRLDPLHMVELRGYLGIVPIYGAVLYLVSLAVQQLSRDLFPVAYLVSVFGIFAPVAVFILKGP